MPKSKEFVDSSEDSSDGEVKHKKVKSKKQKREDDDDDDRGSKSTSAKKPKKESKDEGENTWELGNNKRVTIREFKGKQLVDIREMYMDKEGDIKPGKKGISMNMTQWRKFMDVVEEVDRVAKSKC